MGLPLKALDYDLFNVHLDDCPDILLLSFTRRCSASWSFGILEVHRSMGKAV